MKISTLTKKLEKAGFKKDENISGPLGSSWQKWHSKNSTVRFLEDETVDQIIVDSTLAIQGGLHNKMNCPVENTRHVCTTWPHVEKAIKEHAEFYPV